MGFLSSRFFWADHIFCGYHIFFGDHIFLETLFFGEENPQAEDLAAGMEKVGAPSAAKLLAHAKEIGTVTTYACSASAQFWGFTPEDLESKVDKVAGITTILRNTRGAVTVLYI